MSNVTMKGNPVTLLGCEVKPGESAPDVTLAANDLSDFQLSSLKGKKVVLSVVLSLDTPVCDVQTKKFSESIGSDVTFITISMDLPSAQKKWCAAAGKDNVITLSDYKEAAFGNAYGVLIEGLNLLSRAIFVVDADGILRYKQIVNEVTQEPNYDEVLEAVKNL